MQTEDIVTFLSIYLIVWWLVLQSMLSFGIKVPENPEEGHADSAPENPKLKIKMVITSIVSAVLTYLIMLGIESEFLF